MKPLQLAPKPSHARRSDPRTTAIPEVDDRASGARRVRYDRRNQRKVDREAAIRLLTAVIAAACLAVSAGRADDPPPELKDKVDRYLVERDRQTKDELGQLESRFATLSLGGERFAKDLPPLKKRIRALKGGKEHATPKLGQGRLEKGRIGAIDDDWTSVEVLQIVDAQNMLVEIVHRRPSQASSGAGEQRSTNTAWVKGVDTSPFAEGAKPKLGGLFEVTGNKSFETVLGDNKTEFVIEPFDLKAIEPYLNAKPKKGRRPARTKRR